MPHSPATAREPARATNLAAELAEPFPLTSEQIAAYRRDGFIKLKQVLSPEVLAAYGAEISREVAERSRHYAALDQRDTYGKAFLQICNLWEVNAVIADFVRAPRLGRIAAELMGTRGTRLYHDQALCKEAGGGFTPWHADQRYWPLSSDHSVTAWIPLQAVPQAMGPLAFAVGSQHLVSKRASMALAIGDESERVIARTLSDCSKVETAYDLGEVSFHAGWTFHRAGPNTTNRLREVMTIIYIDRDMVISEPANDSQANDLKRWFPGQKPGESVASPLNPVVWAR
jgi:ectoine hydroxylase-related dioxygenase (phytanoyl-CoA dioxygenase family)